jgi:hypothetical protein
MATKKFDPREISIALEAAVLDDFGKTAFAILRNLIFASPVGNPDAWKSTDFGRLSAPAGYVGGHFRRNWLVSIGGFNESQVEGTDAAGATTLAAGFAQIKRHQAGKLGPNLVIQNNVPYANRLAQGHSAQAEAGWVDEEVDNGLNVPGGTEELK